MFIDTERESWNMDPVALEKAFEIYPDVKLVVCAELYGFSGDIAKIKEICEGYPIRSNEFIQLWCADLLARELGLRAVGCG